MKFYDVIIPMNALNHAKSRIRSQIPERYHEFIEDLMFAVYMHVLKQISRVSGVAIHVITPDLFLRDVVVKQLVNNGLVCSVHLDEGKDLNNLQSILLNRLQLDSAFIVMADLPLLASKNFSRFLRRVMVIKPDLAIVPSHDDPPGTSILYLQNLRDFKFQYGTDSYWNHVEQARDLNYLIYSCNDFQLSFDIDTWDDLVELGLYLTKKRSIELDLSKTKNSLQFLQRLISLLRTNLNGFFLTQQVESAIK